MTRQTRRLLISGTLLLTLIGLSLWGAIYVGTRGFVRKWRMVFAEEMARNHLAMTVDRLTLEPNAGLSGRGMVVYSDRTRELPLVFIDHSQLGVHLPSLVVGQPAVRQLVVRDGLLAFADKEGAFPLGRPILLGVRATLTPMTDAWLLEDFQAMFPGLEISGRAQIAVGGGGNANAVLIDGLRRAMEVLAAMEAERESGQMTFNLSGEDARGWKGTIDFEAADIRWGDTRFRQIMFSIELDDDWLHLRDLYLETDEGQLSGRARVSKKTGEGRFIVNGDLGPTLLSLLPGLPEGFGTGNDSRAMIQVDGTWWMGAQRPEQLTGSVSASDFSWQEEPMLKWTSDFAYHSGEWNLRNTRLETAHGWSELTFLLTGEEVRWRCRSSEPVGVWAKRMPKSHHQWLLEAVPAPEPGPWQLEVRGDSWDVSTWRLIPASGIATSAE